MPRLLCALLSPLVASAASAVTMDWTFIGNSANSADSTGYGAVGYAYSIGTYEVTNAQYAEFLNAKAASDTLALYSEAMSTNGGITRTGSDGSYSYSLIAGYANMPVNWVSWYDAVRFANWLNNGQGSGDTETGAYTITEQGIVDNSITRNAGAAIFLTSEDEWYKAAYYDPSSASYFDYPTGTDTPPTCYVPTATANTANCGNRPDPELVPVGSYPGSASLYGTFDQGGNVEEWNETASNDGGASREIRGGSWGSLPYRLSAADFPILLFFNPFVESSDIGFRLTMIPEPGRNLLLAAGVLSVLGLAGWRRRQH